MIHKQKKRNSNNVDFVVAFKFDAAACADAGQKPESRHKLEISAVNLCPSRTEWTLFLKKIGENPSMRNAMEHNRMVENFSIYIFPFFDY